MVPRFVRSTGHEGGEKIVALLQQIAELRYEGVHRFEELDPREQRKWIKFSDAVARAQHNVSKLTEILEDAIQRELAADLRLLEAEVDDIEQRRDADEMAAAKQEERQEVREAEERDRANAIHQDTLADRQQAREERKARHRQELIERKLLMGITVFLVLISVGLLVLGVLADKPLVVGGSTISAVVSIVGLVKVFFFGWGKGVSQNDRNASQ